MCCSSGGNRWRNIPTILQCLTACCKAAGFSLFKLFMLHNPPPSQPKPPPLIQNAHCLLPPFHIAQKNTHARTHYQCGMAVFQRGAPVSLAFKELFACCPSDDCSPAAVEQKHRTSGFDTNLCPETSVWRGLLMQPVDSRLRDRLDNFSSSSALLTFSSVGALRFY